MTTNTGTETVLIPVDEIRNNYLPVYPVPRNWDNTIKYMMEESPNDRIVVEHLMRWLETNEHFREPIAVESQELFEENKEDEEAEGDEDNEYVLPNILNGTHRVVASILYGAKTILAEIVFPNAPYNTSPKMAVSKVHFSEFYEEEHKEELNDHIIAASSFPLNDDIWLTSSFAAGNSKYHEIYWENDPEEITEEILEQISEALADFLNALTGMPVEKVITALEKFE